MQGYIAIQDDCVRKNLFDFKLSEVLENDTKEKVALTEEQEQALLSFIKTDNVYHKYYDDVDVYKRQDLCHRSAPLPVRLSTTVLMRSLSAFSRPMGGYRLQ